MSKGVTKIQLALAVYKGKKIELQDLKEGYARAYAKVKGMNAKVPRTVFHTMIDTRIKEIDHEIVGLEKRAVTIKSEEK